MSFAVVVTLLAASPALEAFWARDLGALARAADEDAFSRDLYGFVTCEPLEGIEATADAKRLLLRLEQARWVRLSADTSGTLFEDLRSEKFFSRSSTPFSGEKLLVWPAEEERWSGEVPVVSVPASPCQKPSSSLNEAVLLGQLLAREAELPKPLVARLRFEAAVVALQSGDEAAAREHAQKLDASALDEKLRFHASLLRTVTKVEGAPSLSELMPSAPAGLKGQLAAHAGFDAARRNDWTAALSAVSTADGRGDILSLYSLLAADRAGNAAQVRAALMELKWPEGSDRTANTLRALAVDAAVRSLGGADLVELQKRWDGGYGAPSVDLLAQLAIAKNRLDVVAELKTVIEKASRRKKAAQLGVELAFITSDKNFPAIATAFIDDAEAKAAGERTAKSLARRLALNASKNPAGWNWFVGFVQARFEISNKKTWQEALSLAQSETVVVPAAFEVPEPPPLLIAWPKVHSLLMLPTTDGSHRFWFGAPEELARAH